METLFIGPFRVKVNLTIWEDAPPREPQSPRQTREPEGLQGPRQPPARVAGSREGGSPDSKVLLKWLGALCLADSRNRNIRGKKYRYIYIYIYVSYIYIYIVK